MDDITALIMDDHHAFRLGFARLDDAQGAEELAAIWQPLALHLDIHAEAEEEIFYPQLLRRRPKIDPDAAREGGEEKGGGDPEEESDDAIRDHNKIRDAVAEAGRHEVGSDEWWRAVWTARTENSDHLAEEEDEVLPDFRRRTSMDLRYELGAKWLRFYGEHPQGRELAFRDKDPRRYIAANESAVEEVAPNQ
ncbi:hemerythrin domain-containing protein [Rhizomonospora bruguierae]|uniref:hemerythrin domain-containing protein n=1 Tax=Rhizomonospora bruguierae TaxID=1581705 RepID=UPI0020C0A8AB|nr:hemerythrin domain-containing protein [Micromonospora sp. NBRC 107566]